MNHVSFRFMMVCIIAAIIAFFLMEAAGAQSRHHMGCCSDRWDPGKSERGHWGRGHMGQGHHQRMRRHWTFMHQGIPAPYRGAKNPIPDTPANVKAGAVLYQDHCAQCHGRSGMGDGKAGRSLNPSPALLAHLVQRPMSVDGYLLWSISEGGKQFDTGMPAFKEALKTDDIWKLIVYMRSGFPEVD